MCILKSYKSLLDSLSYICVLPLHCAISLNGVHPLALSPAPPRHLAATLSRTEVVNLLWQENIDYNLVDAAGRTARMRHGTQREEVARLFDDPTNSHPRLPRGRRSCGGRGGGVDGGAVSTLPGSTKLRAGPDDLSASAECLSFGRVASQHSGKMNLSFWVRHGRQRAASGLSGGLEPIPLNH
ncbi:hypothetical protein K438DRAFT_1941751 [Mycena galopus ATCC 62051]|nr:hypothetical protein K438DRAFT_1941751 [Mycena galopus ATCC 62051]